MFKKKFFCLFYFWCSLNIEENDKNKAAMTCDSYKTAICLSFSVEATEIQEF